MFVKYSRYRSFEPRRWVMQSCARYDERLVPRDDVRETVPKEDLLMVPNAGLHGRLDSVLQLVGRVVQASRQEGEVKHVV